MKDNIKIKNQNISKNGQEDSVNYGTHSQEDGTHSQKEREDFDKKLVDKIKQKKIKPYSRWHFLLKNYVVWIVGFISLIIGATAVSVMMYFLKYSGWDIWEKTHQTLLSFFLLTLPYFWLIFLGIFIFILYYNLKHTKRGYRYPIWLIVSVSILASIILGSIMFLTGCGQKIDDVLGEQMPLYNKVINRQVDFWFNPQEGRLAGLVSQIDDDRNFNIIDPRDREWKIFVKSDELPATKLKLGQPVNIIGQEISDNEFQAWLVRPVHPGRKFLLRTKIHKDRLYDNHPPLLPSQTPIPNEAPPIKF
jgi:heme/copper-type cytochrome/quinol oxidase subunit 2